MTVPKFKISLCSFLKQLMLVLFILMIPTVLFVGCSKGSTSAASKATYKVERRDLTISVTESGNIRALNSISINCNVDGRNMIIGLIEEGTFLTEEDVEKGTILCEIDSSQMRKDVTKAEISFASAEASYKEAQEAYDIQIKQNESDINASKLKLRFGLIDLQKYLGATLANDLVERSLTDDNISEYIPTIIKDAALGGEAKQKLRELTSEISLKDGQHQRSVSKLGYTEKLYEKKYASKTELEADQYDVDSNQVNVEKVKTSLELYKLYEFPKQTEKYLSDYKEFQLELERTFAKARSREAQAKAKLESNRARYELEMTDLARNREQLAACIIRAPAPGLVIYASSLDRWGRDDRRIELGATVRERQKLIEIPDPSVMAVEIQVRESWVDKVKPGQRTKVVVDAFPDKVLEGEVMSIAPLPNPEKFWQDTGVKAYKTMVKINGTHEYLKPGMSTKVEVIINELEDVLCVPLQAIANRDNNKVCFISQGDAAKELDIQTGAFNDSYIEVISGLQEGQDVLLVPPRDMSRGSKDKGDSKKEKNKPSGPPKMADEKKEKRSKPDGKPIAKKSGNNQESIN